ncbi:hypothetical protein OS242_01245 [Tumebacillus sp. DT12]|uniref:Uncharacterized protein n=1 Tax=Tumebacillus lacus TaxID=2995335 RepID=A0ABT3WV94_9BACL|nr:hypothetical protein [Tumebacillus lacus]MCX7568593.1 hypothetical protein [Tumebacillus lacus]
MRSDALKVINLYEVPITDVKRLVDVLQSDLKEYENLDADFEPGTEDTIKRFLSELSRHLD